MEYLSTSEHKLILGTCGNLRLFLLKNTEHWLRKTFSQRWRKWRLKWDKKISWNLNFFFLRSRWNNTGTNCSINRLFCFEELIGEQWTEPLKSLPWMQNVNAYVSVMHNNFSISIICALSVYAHLRRSRVLAFLCSLVYNMVIVQSDDQCARSQFNESHLQHICTFIPLQGEILLPKQSLRRVEVCDSVLLYKSKLCTQDGYADFINPFRSWWPVGAYIYVHLRCNALNSAHRRGKEEERPLECLSKLPRSWNPLACERDFTNMSPLND